MRGDVLVTTAMRLVQKDSLCPETAYCGKFVSSTFSTTVAVDERWEPSGERSDVGRFPEGLLMCKRS